MTYETLILDVTDKVAHVKLNRPQKANALNERAWDELQHVFETLDQMPEARVVVLSGEGKNFCAGIDLTLFMGLQSMVADSCRARMQEKLRQIIFKLQAPINAIEKCRKPVLAAIHGACVGGGVDIVTACDMRYATNDTFFSIAEIDLGMVADLGTLQRLPKLIGEGIAREMAFTGRRVSGIEAKEIGLINRSFAEQGQMMSEVMQMAAMITAKSPLSIRGTKEVMNYSREHSIADGLNYIATWNAAMLISDDLMKATQAKMQKQTPVFND